MRNTRKWMRITMLSLAGLAFGAELQAQSLWMERDARGHSWIASHTAREIGDLVTVIVEESQDVRDDGRVELSKELQLDSAIEAFDIKPNAFNTLPALKYRNSRTMDGESRYQQTGTFRTTISAVVVDRKPNGNLLIEGFRNIHLDGETKFMRVRGLVRPVDLADDNSILSSRVALAEVYYDTHGERSRSTSKGWWEKFMDVIWPF